MTIPTVDHDLYAKVRDLACQREPTLSWEQIADTVNVPDGDELAAWFLSYRLPPPLAALERRLMVSRNPDLKAELARLRDREASLLTMCEAAPAELAIIQRRINNIVRTH